MAGDWIKMRSSLLDHPKVIAITRMLLETRAFRDWLRPGGGAEMNGQIVSQKASRAVTVASLMCAWSNARMHGKFVDEDLHLPFSSIEDLDEFAGVPGIGAAMEKVEWAERRAGKNGIFLPRFKEFNVPMTEAERARNYRARKTYPQSQSVTRPSRHPRDENSEIVTTRERERSKEPKTTPSTRTTVAREGQPGSVASPDWEGPQHVSESLDDLRVGHAVGTALHEAAGALHAALSANGCKGSASHPQVVEWARQSVTVTVLKRAIVEARKSNDGQLSPQYLAPIVDRLRKGLDRKSESAAWATDDKACEAKARELGLWPAKPGMDWDGLRTLIREKINQRAQASVT